MAIRKEAIPIPSAVKTPSNGQGTTAKEAIDLTDINIPEGKEAQVTATVKYTKAATKPPTTKTVAVNNQQQNGNQLSDSPLLDFLDDWRGEPDVYVLATRLADNPLNPKEFLKPCMSPTTFQVFPFDAANFISNLIQINNGSGGYFKAVIVDENMQELNGVKLPRTAIANPFGSEQPTTVNNNESDVAKLIRESEERNRQLIEKLNQPSELDVLSKTIMMKQIEKFMTGEPNANGNALAGLPPETQALVSVFQNPVAMKAATSRISEVFSTMFSSDEKTAETVNKAVTIGERIMTLFENDEALRSQAMEIGGKLVNLAGFGLSKILGNRKGGESPERKAHRERREAKAKADAETQTQSNPQPNDNINNDYRDPNEYPDVEPETEKDYIDAEPLETDDEFDARMDAIQATAEFTEVLTLIDSDAPLTLEHKFLTDLKEKDALTYATSMAFFKHSSFPDSINEVYNKLPFIEDLVLDQPRRLERLKELHLLIVNS